MKTETAIDWPKNWRVRRICEVANVKGGKRLPAGKEFAGGETPFPYLRVTDMMNGTIQDSNIAFVKPEIEPIIRHYKISSNDLYVTIAGTLGQFGRIPRKFNNAQLTENAAKITDINKSLLDLDYLYYFLRSDEVAAQVNIATGIGAGVPKLPLYQIERLIVRFPTQRSEQRKIARILTTVDNLIEKTEALIAKYQAIKQGMMHDLFTRGVDDHGHLRPSYDEAPELYKESELGWIPKEWEVESISDLGRWSGGMTPSKSVNGYWRNGTILWVTSKDVKTRLLDKTENQITIEGLENTALQLLPIGSIIVVFRSGILRHTLPVSMAMLPLAINQDLKALVVRANCDPWFVFSLIKSLEQRILRSAVKAGTTVESVDGKTFFSWPIGIPQLAEQKKISARLLSLDETTNKEQEQLVKLRLLKTGLMQDLLTGKVRVKVEKSGETAA